MNQTSSGLVALTAVALAGFAAPALAQDPLLAHCTAIRLIVPYTAGGGGDVGARQLAPKLGEELGLQVVVENLPGAGSQVGITALTQAEPDGCTIGFAHLPATIAIYADPSRQSAFGRAGLEPIAMHVIDGGGIAVRGDAPYHNLADLIEAAKADPGGISISDSGVLSDGHLLLMELQRQAGVEFAIVHSGGGGEGMADLLGGHTNGMASNLGGVNIGLAEAGEIRMLATFTEEPSPDYPGVETGGAQGYPILSSTSRTLVAPVGTPEDILRRYSEAVGKVLADPAFQEEARNLGVALHYMDRDELRAYWDQMEATYAPLIAEYAATQQ